METERKYGLRKTAIQMINGAFYYLVKPNENAGAVGGADSFVAEKENGAADDGGLVAVELLLAPLNENIEDGATVSDSLWAPLNEKVDVAEEAAGVEVAENENVDGGLAGVDPFPKKFKLGLAVSTVPEPNWNFFSSFSTFPELNIEEVLNVSSLFFSLGAAELRLDSKSFKCFS